MSGMCLGFFYCLQIFEIQIYALYIQDFISKHDGEHLGSNFFKTDILSK